MLKFLTKFFGRRDALVELCKGPDRAAFAETFLKSDIIFLSIPLPQGIDPQSISQTELLAFLERSTRDLATKTEFEPFVYALGQSTRLPLFTQQKFAEEFVRDVVREWRQVLPVEVLTVSGSVLVETLGGVDAVILNDRTSAAYTLTDDDIRSIKKLAAM